MNSHARRALLAFALAMALPATAAQPKPAPAASGIPGVTAPGTQPQAQATAPVSVNGKTIPRTRLDFIVKQRTAQGQPDTEQVRRALMERIVDQEVLTQEAERKGLARNSDVLMEVDLARREILSRALFNDYLKTHPIRDDALKAQYDAVKAQRGNREYRARHILVDTEATAKEITEKLKKGEKFEDLAKQSKDPGSKDRGGDLDWAAPGNYVKPFADALVKLEKGKITESPVQTQFGWHVIRMDDTRTTQFPPFEQVKPQILNAMQQQEFQKMVGELRSKAKIE